MNQLLDQTQVASSADSDTLAAPLEARAQQFKFSRRQFFAMQFARVLYALVALVSAGIAITHPEYFPHAQPVARISVSLVAGIGALLCSGRGIWHDVARLRRL